MASLRTQYDTTVYDSPAPPPTFGGVAKPTAGATPALKIDYGDLVTTPPLGTSNPNAPLSPTTPPKAPTPTTPPVVTTPTTTGSYQNTPEGRSSFLQQFADKPWFNASLFDSYLAGHPDWTANTDYWSRRFMDAPGEGSNAAPAGSGGFDFSNFSGLGNLFDDPAAASLMGILQQRIGQLSQPINDPNAAVLTQQIQDAIAHLNQMQGQTVAPLPAMPQAPPMPGALPSQMTVPELPDYGPQFAALQKAIADNTASTTGPTAKYQGILDKLVSDLSQPAFSDDQLGQLKTAAVDTLNHEHQLALDNKARAMGMQGIPPSSGIAQEALKNVDAQYQGLKAQALQSQNVAEIAMINERRQQLMSAASSGLQAAQAQQGIEQQGLLAQLQTLMNQRGQDIGLRGQNIDQSNAAQQLALGQRSQDIGLRGQEIDQQNAAQNLLLNQRAQDIGLRGQDIASTTAGVTLAQALSDLSRNQRLEQSGNLDKAVSLAGIPVDLSAQRLNQALSVLGLGGGTTPTNLLGALSTIAGQTGISNQTNAGNSAAMWKTIGDLIAGFGK